MFYFLVIAYKGIGNPSINSEKLRVEKKQLKFFLIILVGRLALDFIVKK